MLKQSLGIIICLFTVCVLFAQKVDQQKVKVHYTQLPTSPLDPEYTTYSTYVYGSGSSIEGAGYTREGLATNFKLKSFKEVGTGGHFRISVRVGSLDIGESKNQSYTKKVKQDDKEVTKTYYKRVITWMLPVSYQIHDYKGNMISQGTMGNTYKKEEWGSGNTSSYTLSKKWSDARKGVYNRWRKNGVKTSIGQISKLVRSKYDFRPVSENEMFETLKIKKKDSFDSAKYNEALETLKTAFEKMKADEPVDVLKPEVKPAVDFWLSEKDKYPASDKKLSKIRHICLNNLALTFYYLDELDEAKKYATECLEIKFRDGRTKRLIKEIERTRELFVTNNMTTRHPSFDVESATPPSAAKFGDLDESDEEGTTLDGTVVNNAGDKIEGSFKVAVAEEEELKFGPEGNVVFSYVKDGRTTEDALDPGTTKEFNLGERHFYVDEFVPGSKGNTESKTGILEILYTSPSIKVLKYYPYDDKLGDQPIEYAFQKGEEAPVSTSSTSFLLFNKGLSKFFADCTDLAEAAGGGEFKKEEADIIRAARVYGEMCQ